MDRAKKILKWVGIAFGGLVVVLGVGVGVASCMASSADAVTYETPDHAFDVPSLSDPDRAAEAERLYMARGCGECHGADGTGRVLVDAPPFMVAPPNITGVARAMEPTALHRLIRRGIRADGTSVFFMPAHEYQRMPDEELGLIIAHARSLPQSDTQQPPNELRLLGQVLDTLGVFDTPLRPASMIDQSADFDPASPDELGEYLAMACRGCHGPRLSGGPIPGAPEDQLGRPANLTQHSTGLEGWTEEDFSNALRNGVRPDGEELNPDQMPSRVYRFMSDEEVSALWAFLQTVDPQPYGNR